MLQHVLSPPSPVVPRVKHQIRCRSFPHRERPRTPSENA